MNEGKEIRSELTKKYRHLKDKCLQIKRALFSGSSVGKDETSVKQNRSAIIKFYRALQIENFFFMMLS